MEKIYFFLLHYMYHFFYRNLQNESMLCVHYVSRPQKLYKSISFYRQQSMISKA